MSFDQRLLIPDVSVFRAALVSPEHGGREINRLAAAGEINPTRTATRRTLLTIGDARRVYEALCPPSLKPKRRNAKLVTA
jgi:hypothetical protein